MILYTISISIPKIKDSYSASLFVESCKYSEKNLNFSWLTKITPPIPAVFDCRSAEPSIKSSTLLFELIFFLRSSKLGYSVRFVLCSKCLSSYNSLSESFISLYQTWPWKKGVVSLYWPKPFSSTKSKNLFTL